MTARDERDTPATGGSRAGFGRLIEIRAPLVEAHDDPLPPPARAATPPPTTAVDDTPRRVASDALDGGQGLRTDPAAEGRSRRDRVRQRQVEAERRETTSRRRDGAGRVAGDARPPDAEGARAARGPGGTPAGGMPAPGHGLDAMLTKLGKQRQGAPAAGAASAGPARPRAGRTDAATREPIAATSPSTSRAHGGGRRVGGHPDSFAASLRSGAFRGTTSAGECGIRAWVRAWQAREGRVAGSAAEVDAPGPAMNGAVAAGAARPMRWGEALRQRAARSDQGATPAGAGAAHDAEASPTTAPRPTDGPGAAGTRDAAPLPGWLSALKSVSGDRPAPAEAASTAAGASDPAGTPAPPAGFQPLGGSTAAAAMTPPAVAPGIPGPATMGAPPAPATAGARGVDLPGTAHSAPGGTAEGVRIRVPTTGGETVRGRMFVDPDTRAVRVVLAAQEGETAQSMSRAHELLRLRLADEGYRLDSFIVRHDGRAVVRIENAGGALSGGVDDGAGDHAARDERTAQRGDDHDDLERSRHGVATQTTPEDTVASGWFV